MDEATKKLSRLIKQAAHHRVPLHRLSAVHSATEFGLQPWQLLRRNFRWLLAAALVVSILVAVHSEWTQDRCYVAMPSPLRKAFRVAEPCDFCSHTAAIERVANLTPALFEQRYAYSARPVVVTDAMVNWTAPKIFDFWYFKDVYERHGNANGRQMNCQFFPYESNLNSLADAFDLDLARINYEPGTQPWYFGWSNCNDDVAAVLRRHYTRPYFLPDTAENNAIDWIFMGGPGLGAHLHVDNVRLPSWQAQLRGAKKWILAPPPECYYRCRFFETIVQPGEIIVLDTNKWFHQTIVQPGELSITIGAEFD